MVVTVILTMLSIAWFVLSIYLSHQNGIQTYQTSIGLASWIRDRLEQMGLFEDGAMLGWVQTDTLLFVHEMLRHFAHIGIFTVMTMLLCLNLKWIQKYTRKKLPLWAGSVFCLLWSWVDEVSKIPIEGRHFSWFDVGLNLIGCVFGIMLAYIVMAIWKRLKRKSTYEFK